MELFENVFRKSFIYESLYFNIISVTEYADVFQLKENDINLFKQWESIGKVKYNINNYDDESYMLSLDDVYKTKAIFYPEFSKIVAITYATLEPSDGKIIRHLKKIINNDEFEVIKSFQEILLQISSDGVKSKPQYFPSLCGYNIINNDIPLFIKRLLKYRDRFEEKINILPYILKKYLESKPWDCNVVDISNIWKYNGLYSTSILTISEFLNLKRNVNISSMNEISEYYWENINNNEEETLKNISLQSANLTNLVIQIVNELRSL